LWGNGERPHFRVKETLKESVLLQNTRLTFVRNGGELAEGWYDPATLQKAQASAAAYDDPTAPPKPRSSPKYDSPLREETSDEDVVGPMLPGQEVAAYKKGKRPGPAIPNTQDLQLRQGSIPTKPLTFWAY